MKPSPSEIRGVLRYGPKTGLLWWRASGSGRRLDIPAGTMHREGYVRIRYKNLAYGAHQLAWVITKGRWPKKQIDHRDTVRWNNRWANLRLATHGQNKQNGRRYKNNKSGFKRVSRKGKRWVAHISYGGKQYHLGVFDTPEEAAAVYSVAACEYHGAFARTS